MRLWEWFWPAKRMRLRRETFLQHRGPLADADFLTNLGYKRSLDSAIAIALRRSLAEACSVPSEKLLPSDSIDELRRIIDWGNPSWGWLMEDGALDPIILSKQFEQELSRIAPEFPYGALQPDWYNKLPFFAPRIHGIFARRKNAINLGGWFNEAVAVILSESSWGRDRI